MFDVRYVQNIHEHFLQWPGDFYHIPCSPSLSSHHQRKHLYMDVAALILAEKKQV